MEFWISFKTLFIALMYQYFWVILYACYVLIYSKSY